MKESLIVGVAFLFLLSVGSLGAQSRDGLWVDLGGAVGVGSLGSSRGTPSLIAGHFGIGVSVSEEFLLGGEASVWSKTGSEQFFVSLVAYLYPVAGSGFFLKGGPGLARLTVERSVRSGTQDGLATVLGLGYDARLGSGLSFRLFLNFAVGLFPANVTTLGELGLGFSWN